MSRIGATPVSFGKDVVVKYDESSSVLSAKGSVGELSVQVPAGISVTIAEDSVTFVPSNDNCSNQDKANWGLVRALFNNCVIGVKEGFKKELEVLGVGYKAQVQGNNLKLSLGYSHDIDFPIPQGIKIETPKPTEIVIFGADKQQVGQIAAEIREFRKPEPYKGKGVRLKGEFVRRKEGKKK